VNPNSKRLKNVYRYVPPRSGGDDEKEEEEIG